MENINEHIDNLLIRYKNGQISNEEAEELFTWIELNSENRNYFKEQMKIIGQFGPKNIDFKAEKGLNNIFKKRPDKNNSPVLLKVFAIAASIAILFTLGFLVFNSGSETKNEILSFNSGNAVLSLTLDDSSEVYLSKNSTLTKLKQFNPLQRMVGLKGKAFFKVEKEHKRPFTVMAGNIEILVMGTSFEVENDSVHNIVKVAVSEGRVLVKHKSVRLSKVLIKNDQITINQQGELLENITLKNENHLAWKTGILTFNNAPMKDVVKELSRLYEKTFSFGNQEIESFILTTKIDKQPLDEVKIILEKTLDLEVLEKNDTIFLLLP